MRQGIILLFGLFVILGCGYQSSPNEENENITAPTSTSFSQKTLPTKISVNFPTALKDTITSSSQSNDRAFEEKKETNLQQLQKDIYKVEDVVQVAEFNMLLLEQVMPEILRKCEGINHCLFEEKELTFLLDKEIIRAIDNVLDEKERDFLDTDNSVVYLGEIEFFKHDNQKYEYELNFNMLNSSFVKKSSLIKEQRQILKWSSSSANVIITYLYKSTNDKTVTTVRYFINNEGKELMYLSDKNYTHISIENTTLVVKNSDDSSAYSLTSNTTIQQLSEKETNSSHFSTNIEVDNSTTQLLLVDKDITTNRLNEQRDELLDVVVVATQPIVVTGPGTNMDTTSPLIKEEKLTLFVFEVDGEGLSSGDYILLKPDTDTTKLSLEELLDVSIGSFSVMEGRPQGSLHSDEFLDILNEIVIVKIINSQETTRISEFILIENKAKLNIVKK